MEGENILLNRRLYTNIHIYIYIYISNIKINQFQ